MSGLTKPTTVISLNALACDIDNLFSMSYLTDPVNSISWLESQLESIEKNNGLAIIISHIEPDECTHQWSERFRAILERY